MITYIIKVDQLPLVLNGLMKIRLSSKEGKTDEKTNIC